MAPQRSRSAKPNRIHASLFRMRKPPAYHRGKYHKVNKNDPQRIKDEINTLEYMFAKFKDIIKNNNITLFQSLVLDKLMIWFV